MKLNYILLISLLGTFSPVFAQKPALTFEALENWSSAGSPAISNDGRYVSYAINNRPLGSSTTVVQGTKGNWKTEMRGITDAVFSQDSRKLIYMKGDSLCLLTLGSAKIEKIFPVSYFRLFNQGKQELLALPQNNANSTLLLRNLSTGNTQSYAGVGLFFPSDNGQVMLLQKSVKSEKGLSQQLEWLDIASGKTSMVWQGTGNPGSFVFDAAASQLAFTLTEKVNRKEETSFWYYKPGTEKAVLLADKATPGLDAGLKLENTVNFSKDGKRVFVKLKEQDFPKPKPDAVKVDVWSYTDPKLQSQQLKNLEDSPLAYLIKGSDIGLQSYSAILDPTTRRFTRLEQENEKIDFLGTAGEESELAALYHLEGDGSESHWSTKAQLLYSLISTRTGERSAMHLEGSPNGFSLSPDGTYLVYGGSEGIDLYSYNLASGVNLNLTGSLPIPLGDGLGSRNDDMAANLKSRGISVAGWMIGGKSILVYDRYDIWQLDPSGRAAPVNLTGGYGRKHHTVLRMIKDDRKPVQPKEKLLLAAFNNDNKYNGFYRLNLGKNRLPELLTMGPYLYHMPHSPTPGSAPIKARDAEVYLVQRESAAESPNIFMTADFKNFAQLTEVYPEKAYNWMRSELVSFKTLDGKNEQGALYKPEDFDPAKKYPVIIQYYERKTEYLNTYHRPETAGSEINIPWFVSRGYLVFTPDIHYKIGEPGESALNTVVGAANHLKVLDYVDGKKIALQGHSFGGFQTNYIVTHSNLFAAAISAAAPSDMISFYNDLWGTGNSKQPSVEVNQLRMGATLWERPDLYIKNSPIFDADKVTTPLLMMQNKEDGAISFHHGVELFSALRRLGKRAWMLQYDKETHSLINAANRKDYTIRMTQFFDHYLKDAPAPQWMIRGIPAKMKGVDDGLALDSTGATPGPGLLIGRKKQPTKTSL